MSTLLKDIVDYFIEINAAEEYGVDIFTDFAPEVADSIIILYEYTSGPVPLHVNVAQRSVQVVVRDKSPTVAKQKAYELFNALHADDKLIHFTDDRFGLVTLRNTPVKTDVDEANRHYYKFNIGITTKIEGMV